MTSERKTRRVRRLALAIGIAMVLLVGVGVYAATHDENDAPVSEETPSVLQIEEDGLRYTYHLPTDTESLFDVRKDPRCLTNLFSTRRAEAERLRRTLERRLGVRDLRDLLDPNDPTVENLRGLGYL